MLARRLRPFLLRSITVSAALIVGLGVCEVAVRVWFRGASPSLFADRNHLVPADQSLAVYEYAAGAEFGRDGMYKINSRGVRDREYAVPKPDDVYRIAALGDSYTFGQGVAVDETWPRVLEAHLSGRMAPLSVEVMNFGVQGYNTSNELGMLKGTTLDFQPDLVLLAHLINDDGWDLMRVVRGEVVFYHAGDPDSKIPLPTSIKQLLHDQSLLFRLLSVRYLNLFRQQIVAQQRREREEHLSAVRELSDDEPRRTQGIDAQSIRRIADICRTQDIELVILDFAVTPLGVATTKGPKQTAIGDQLRSLAQELDVGYVDTFPALKGRQGLKLRVAKDDHHPNGELNRSYAALLAEALEKRMPAPH